MATKRPYLNSEDAKLVRMIRDASASSERAFNELNERYSHRIYAYCLRVLGNESEAQDLFQETFIRFYKACCNGTDIRNVVSYLLKTARNLYLNIQRDRKLNVPVEDYHLVEHSNRYEKEELLELIAAALEVLNFPLREAFVLRHYQQLSYREIADITGDSVDVLKFRVWSAKEKIKTILAPYLNDLPVL